MTDSCTTEFMQQFGTCAEKPMVVHLPTHEELLKLPAPEKQPVVAVYGFPDLTGQRKQKGDIFVLIGDGECQEGEIWEAAMATVHHKVENLTVIVDVNGIQNDDFVKKFFVQQFNINYAQDRMNLFKEILKQDYPLQDICIQI